MIRIEPTASDPTKRNVYIDGHLATSYAEPDCADALVGFILNHGETHSYSDAAHLGAIVEKAMRTLRHPPMHQRDGRGNRTLKIIHS
jgi:hypothetical protein